MPDKKQSAKRRLRLLIVIGVFLLAVELVVIGGRQMFGADNLVVGWSDISRLISRAIGKQGDNQQNAASLDASEPQPPLFDNEHYPIMAMIDNSPEARASGSGLSSAIIVYETLVEGGATRLAAVFAGPPAIDRLGPIRSIRPVFVDIASELGAFLWHAGGSPEALALLRTAPVIDLNEISYLGPRYFWRDYKKPRPHNLFTDSERMKLALTDLGLKNPLLYKEGVGGGSGMVWQWGEPPLSASSSPATTIAIDFSFGLLFDVGYTYDAANENYIRFLGNRPHVDRAVSAQIAVDNVVIQRVPAEGYYPSGYGRLIINVIGEGEALFFRDGRAYGGRWRKADRASQTEWLADDGTSFPLKPGTVWVEIVPGRRVVTYQ